MLRLKNLSIFDNLSILLLDSLEREGGEGRLSSGRIRVKGIEWGWVDSDARPRVWADSRNANARNWWTPWYVCASRVMSLVSENREARIYPVINYFSPTTIPPPIETFANTRFHSIISNAFGYMIRCINSIDNLGNFFQFDNSTSILSFSLSLDWKLS